MATKKLSAAIQAALKNNQLADIAALLSPEQISALGTLKADSDKKAKERAGYDVLVTEKLKCSIQRLKAVQEELVAAKTEVYKDFSHVIAEKRRVYDVKDHQKSFYFADKAIGGFEIGYRELDRWMDKATAGIEKIRTVIESLASNDDEKAAVIVKALNELLGTNRLDSLKASSVLKLKSLRKDLSAFQDIDLAMFDDGIEILEEAHRRVQSCWFIEAWTYNAEGKQERIATSLSSAPFDPDFKFCGFN